MAELFEKGALLETLMQLANDIRDNYTEHLAQSGRYTTEYNLIDSVKTQVESGNQCFEVTMTLKDYWKYVEDDTRPHFPPTDAILNWIRIKPVLPRPDANGNLPSEKQLAYLIGRKIANYGTKGSHDLEAVKDNVIPWYIEKIQAALVEDVEKYILKVAHED